MKGIVRCLVLVVAAGILSAVWCVSLRAQWPDDPLVNLPVSTAPNYQYYPQITPDGSGGAIMTWYDNRNSSTSYDIYAQRVDSKGFVKWTTDGVPICVTSGTQIRPEIVSDGSGGAIITWYDGRNSSTSYDIYAQRVDASGAVMWTANGVPVCRITGSQYYPQLTSDGSGGAIITWQDYRSSSNRYDIYAQRVNASGAVQWTTNGLAICTAPNYQYYPQITSDGSGGAIITWYDNRVSSYDIYAQRVSSSGAVQWTTNGVVICNAASYQYRPELVPDGSGGAIITWYDYRNSSNRYDIYAQRVNASGAVQWTTNGVAICTAPNYQYYPQIASDGSGGAIITWFDSRVSSYDIYAQRVSSSGAVQWTANGVAICTAPSYQYYPEIVSAGSGGAIITWYDYRNSGNGYDIYAQKVDGSGSVLWTADGVPICLASGSQYRSVITTDGKGGGIIAWYDYRNSSSVYDIYAQNVLSNGALGKPPAFEIVEDLLAGTFSPPNPWTQIGMLEFSFTVSAGETDVTRLSFCSDPLQHGSRSKKISENMVEFIPPEIGFLAQGEKADVLVKVQIPIGQHEGGYSGYFRAICDEGLSDSVEVIVTVRPLADIDFDREKVSLAANPGFEDSDLCVVANPNSWDNNPDPVDGPGNTDLGYLTYKFTDLVGPGGAIPSSAVSVSGNQSSLGSGAADEISIAVDVPVDILAGHYEGMVYVDAGVVTRWQPDGNMLIVPQDASDSLLLEVTVAGSHSLDIVENSLSGFTTPPNPWTEALSVRFLFTVRNTGNDVLENTSLISGDFELAGHSPLDGSDVAFDPPVIGSLDPGNSTVVEATVPVPVGKYAGTYEGFFTAASANGGSDVVSVQVRVGGVADLDIHDYAGNLSANTMELTGVSKSIVVGSFNLVNPNSAGGNFDPFDGPGNVAVGNITADWDHLWTYGRNHVIPRNHVSLVTPFADPLSSGYSQKVLVQVTIPNISTPKRKTYATTFEVAGEWGGSAVSDQFTLLVNVDPEGENNFLSSGFWGAAEDGGNVLRWTGFDLGEVGYDIFRCQEGMESYTRMNQTILTGNSYTDGEVYSGTAYEYKLGIHLQNGAQLLVGPLSIGARGSLPASYALMQNRPNPFSNKTELRYDISGPARVTLRVYDTAGRLVRTLCDEEQGPGRYSVSWDAKDESAVTVPAGVYVYRLQAGTFDCTRKMVILR